ncbi:MAG: metallophosphoesterase [Clostridia bacterium]|nr:metallophosphoesterase [Clostridia bacterium]
MAIYTIADLHLSFNNPKPMDIFGDNWKNHEERLKEDWISKVKDEDTVIIPGDFSWATYIEEAYPDFKYLDELPGKKLLLKGNHDYWWTTVTSMRKYLKDNNFNTIDFVYNNAVKVEDKIIVGTRGWTFQDSENSLKMINRENQRLELSIQDAINKYGTEYEIIAFIHYPPLVSSLLLENKHLEFYKTLKKYDIKRCYYGHLHGKSHADAVIGEVGGINFQLVSGDYLDFKLTKID